MRKNRKTSERDDDDDDPCAVAELGHGEDDHDDKGRHCADGIYYLLAAPVSVVAHGRAVYVTFLAGLHLADALPAHDHAGLRQCERHEHADGIERNQARRVGGKDHDQHRGSQGQRYNAPRKDETAAAIGQLLGQEAVGGNQGPKQREVGIGGVGRHDQDNVVAANVM